MRFRTTTSRLLRPIQIAWRPSARMFGLQPPPIATARVLELGCASGGNLIPMAFNLPDGEFVGIDLSRTHVDAALSTMRALGMRNIRIAHGSILDIDESWGLFDYIICHGVFSWVEPQVQDAILRIAADNLVENGIAYISYNTYPGWHMREIGQAHDAVSRRTIRRTHRADRTGAGIAGLSRIRSG